MLRPFSFDENISSLDTVENFASAGAAPVDLASSAQAGAASTASEAVISAIFFIVVLQCELPLANAAGRTKVPDQFRRRPPTRVGPQVPLIRRDPLTQTDRHGAGRSPHDAARC